MKFSPSKRAMRFLKIMLVLFLAGAWYWWVYVYNPLIGDEKMITNFRENRADFESLVHSYRYLEVRPGVDASGAWLKMPETKKLMAKTSVYHVAYVAPYWIPDPYSKNSIERYKILRREKRYSEFNRMYGSVALYPLYGTRSNNKAMKNTFFYGLIWKNYIHFPEEPLVKGGWLYWPKGRTGYQPKDRIINSLDAIPRNWKSYECVYRRLDAHWFLRMCNGR